MSAPLIGMAFPPFWFFSSSVRSLLRYSTGVFDINCLRGLTVSWASGSSLGSAPGSAPPCWVIGLRAPCLEHLHSSGSHWSLCRRFRRHVKRQDPSWRGVANGNVLLIIDRHKRTIAPTPVIQQVQYDAPG